VKPRPLSMAEVLKGLGYLGPRERVERVSDSHEREPSPKPRARVLGQGDGPATKEGRK
jgi:hypothetical protein